MPVGLHFSNIFPGASVVKNPPANAGDTGDTDSIPGLGRSPGRRNGNPLQYSCQEKSTDAKNVCAEHTHNIFPNTGRAVRLVAQSCPILCDPMDCSPPVSSVHGILQARTLEWVALPSSRGSS